MNIINTIIYGQRAQAVKLTQRNLLEVEKWCRGNLVRDYVFEDYWLELPGGFPAYNTNWVIKLEDGRFLSCSDQTYRNITMSSESIKKLEETDAD